jgi:hypothetical protein
MRGRASLLHRALRNSWPRNSLATNLATPIRPRFQRAGARLGA